MPRVHPHPSTLSGFSKKPVQRAYRFTKLAKRVSFVHATHGPHISVQCVPFSKGASAMCYQPVMTPSGYPRPCHTCRQCRHGWIKDRVGRCVAEALTTKHVNTVCLSYGRDYGGRINHFHSEHLVKSDVTDMLRVLRRNGHPARFLVAGEHGSRNNRAHWHAILFWTGKPPELPPMRERAPFEWVSKFGNVIRPWPHGHVYFDRPQTAGAYAYVIKYATKDYRKDQTLDPTTEPPIYFRSVRPPLGTAYFRQRAVKQVEQGLPPSKFYDFADVGYNQTDDNGISHFHLHQFVLSGAPLWYYLQAYKDAWEQAHPGQHCPPDIWTESEYAKRHTWRDGSPLPSELEIDRFGRQGRQRQHTAGYVSSFRPAAGATEFYERPLSHDTYESRFPPVAIEKRPRNQKVGRSRVFSQISRDRDAYFASLNREDQP